MEEETGCRGGGGVSGEDERDREGKSVERVKERVRDRIWRVGKSGRLGGSDQWSESVHCDWNVSALPFHSY